MVTFVAKVAVDISALEEFLVFTGSPAPTVVPHPNPRTGFSVEDDPVEIDFTGTGFKYFPVATGTIQSIAVYTEGALAYKFSGLSLSVQKFFGYPNPYAAIKGILAGNDTTTGSPFSDFLFAYKGNDVLNGKAGEDHLYGGAGFDKLTGGANRDYFEFIAKSDSVVGAKRDQILDFNRAEGDQVALNSIDANTFIDGDQAFTFIGGDTFAHYKLLHPEVAGMVRRAGSVIQIDINANKTVDMEIKIVGGMVDTDFVL